MPFPSLRLPLPTLRKRRARIDADWIDEQGNAYNYRDDVISILFMGIDYMGDEKNWFYATESNGRQRRCDWAGHTGHQNL